MRDKDLYSQILGIKNPWQVVDVELALGAGEVKVYVEHDPGIALTCPTCGEACAGYDKRRREWRHLDTCQFRTLLVADVPRVSCKEHGVHTIAMPWAEPGSGLTALFESLVIDWLQEASIKAVARQLQLSWKAVDGVMQRAVHRGLARRERQTPTHLSVDETSFRKGHDYVTVVTDQDQGHVLHVSDDNTKASLESFYDSLDEAQKSAVESVAMDMWPAYINTTLAAIPGAREKIAFDKFHVAKYLGDAVDKVRKQEHRALLQAGDSPLTGSKYRWLTNPNNMDRERWNSFKALRESTLKTARAWGIKQLAMSLWHYVSRTWAEKAWKRWLSWAMRSRLEPMKKAAATLRNHLWGIINAIVLNVHNGHAESMNSRIKMIKTRSCGFRNKLRFRNAIYFHLGGLDLYPKGL